ncbi:hypothetical protein [Streptomyces sp. NPDC005438]|uniref:hypothetical protein n=1 Tax=Streptomyces sp. NPDC005438 TaxID=3156880 RepID=UPI0033B101CF
MNNRSITRGDLVVAIAALLLLFASFLQTFSVNNCDGVGADENPWCSSAWESTTFPYLPGVTLLGLVAAGLIVGSRFVPSPKQVIGLRLDQWGMAFTIPVVWSAFWTLFAGPDLRGVDVGPGLGSVLSLIISLVLAGGAIASQVTPALQIPVINISGANRAAAPNPYGAQPPGGYGYPGQPQQGQPGGYGHPQPGYGTPPPGGAQPGPGQPGQPFGNDAHQQPTQVAQPGGQTPPPGAPDPNFQPFWFAVPAARPLHGEDGSGSVVAELTPGTWYLAIEQRGQVLVAQTQDGRRGVLQDTSGIQRG